MTLRQVNGRYGREFWGGGAPVLNAGSGRREGMIPDGALRHGFPKPFPREKKESRSSRGVRPCCDLSSQVKLVSDSSCSNQESTYIEIL